MKIIGNLQPETTKGAQFRDSKSRNGNNGRVGIILINIFLEMVEIQKSLDQQTLNTGNVYQTSAGNTTGAVINENNFIMEKNLNGENAQQQGNHVAAPEAVSTERASVTADVDKRSIPIPILPTVTQEHQDKLIQDIIKQALIERGYLDENGDVTEVAKKEMCRMMKLPDRDCPNARVKLLYLASELKEAGYVFCYDKENREINNNHVDELHERIKSDKSKCFSETLKVCEVKQALEQGRKVFDVDNKEITLDTPELEKYILIIDGQHRWIVILENPTYDIWVDFVETDNIGAYINNLNNYNKVWNGEDVKHCIREQHVNEVPVLEEIHELKKRFNVSEKYAEHILTRKKEQYRLGNMKKIQSGEKGFSAGEFKVNDTFINTGKKLMHAIRYQFNKEKKAYKCEFVSSLLNIYAELPDTNNASFEKNILIFITAMDGIVSSEILKRIEKKDTQQLNCYVRKQYDTFIGNHRDELDDLYKKAIEIIDEKAQEFEENETNSAKKFKRLRAGSPSDILKNRAEEREEVKKKEEAKAQKNKGTSSKTTDASKTAEKE